MTSERLRIALCLFVTCSSMLSHSQVSKPAGLQHNYVTADVVNLVNCEPKTTSFCLIKPVSSKGGFVKVDEAPLQGAFVSGYLNRSEQAVATTLSLEFINSGQEVFYLSSQGLLSPFRKISKDEWGKLYPDHVPPKIPNDAVAQPTTLAKSCSATATPGLASTADADVIESALNELQTKAKQLAACFSKLTKRDAVEQSLAVSARPTDSSSQLVLGDSNILQSEVNQKSVSNLFRPSTFRLLTSDSTRIEFSSLVPGGTPLLKLYSPVLQGESKKTISESSSAANGSLEPAKTFDLLNTVRKFTGEENTEVSSISYDPHTRVVFVTTDQPGLKDKNQRFTRFWTIGFTKPVEITEEMFGEVLEPSGSAKGSSLRVAGTVSGIVFDGRGRGLVSMSYFAENRLQQKLVLLTFGKRTELKM